MFFSKNQRLIECERFKIWTAYVEVKQTVANVQSVSVERTGMSLRLWLEFTDFSAGQDGMLFAMSEILAEGIL